MQKEKQKDDMEIDLHFSASWRDAYGGEKQKPIKSDSSRNKFIPTSFPSILE